jgi:hypothetical protein
MMLDALNKSDVTKSTGHTSKSVAASEAVDAAVKM